MASRPVMKTNPLMCASDTRKITHNIIVNELLKQLMSDIRTLNASEMTDQENGLVSLFFKNLVSKPVVTFEEAVMKNNDTFINPLLNLTPFAEKMFITPFRQRKCRFTFVDF